MAAMNTHASRLIFRQLFEHQSSTYTYLLGDAVSKCALLIDPVLETVDRDMEQINSLDLKLKYVVNTHCHADHITGSGTLKKQVPGAKSVIGSGAAEVASDVKLGHGEILEFGDFGLIGLSTPGHTNGCMTYRLVDLQAAKIGTSGGTDGTRALEPGSPGDLKMAFTGDAVLIRGCGRTDFQEGDPGKLYDSVKKHVLSLPEDTLLYPAHDYKGRSVTTVAEENKLNPRLSKSRDEFVKIMNELGLPYPKQIDKAVPANVKCGIVD